MKGGAIFNQDRYVIRSGIRCKGKFGRLLFIKRAGRWRCSRCQTQPENARRAEFPAPDW